MVITRVAAGMTRGHCPPGNRMIFICSIIRPSIPTCRQSGNFSNIRPIFNQNHPAMHLAQINIARMIAPFDSDTMKEFRDFIAPINALAEGSPGFVWRLKDEESDMSSGMETPWHDDMMVVNMSVWEDPESLKTFTYKTVHAYFVQKRKRWFAGLDHPHVALWWIAENTTPTLNTAKAKLDHLQENGPSSAVFTLSKTFEAPKNLLK
jgi:hypothetical protein